MAGEDKKKNNWDMSTRSEAGGKKGRNEAKVKSRHVERDRKKIIDVNEVETYVE